MLGSDQVTIIELKDTAVAMTLVGAEGAIKTKLIELIRPFLRGGGGGGVVQEKCGRLGTIHKW